MMSFLGASLIAVLVFLIIGVSARLLAVAMFKTYNTEIR